VRINELAERSGVSAATIKYYIREGLLPGGDRTGYNQVAYAVPHLHRISLIRALLDLGRLPIATVKQVIEAVEDPQRSTHSTLGVAQRAVSGLSVDEVLSVATSLGHTDLADLADAYRTTAEHLAALEIAWLVRTTPPTAPRVGDLLAGDRGDRDALAERAVVGTVLGDALLTALRREAQKAASAAHLGGKA